MTADARVVQLEAALSTLPIAKGKEVDLGQVAFGLAFAASMASMNDRREATVTKEANGVQKEADKVGQAAFALYRTLKLLHGDTHTAYRGRDCQLHKLEDELLGAMKASAAISDDPRYVKPAQRGRRSSRAAQMIADITLTDFESLTGRRATIIVRHDKRGNPAEGHFVQLLAKVFETFGIKASAQKHAKDAIARRRDGKEPGGSGGMVSIRLVKDQNGNPDADKVL